MSEKPARDVGDDGDLPVAGFVNEHAGVAVKAGDPLPIGGIVRIECQCDAADI